jgi:AcrR family transcriptional regulator
MSPSFKPAERERIAARIRESAAELFTTRGLRKTTLEDLVGSSGISKGSFYAFFASKEELYLELALEQVAEIQPRLMERAEQHDTSEERIASLLRGLVEVLDTSPLYRRLLAHPDELRAVSDRLGESQLARVQDQVVRPLIELIERGQADGEVVNADPAVVVGVLQAVLLVPLHARELDPATYPEMLDLLIRSVASGLTRR